MADDRSLFPAGTAGAPGAHPDASLRALLWETGSDPLSVVATAAEMTGHDHPQAADLGARGATELLAAAEHLRTCTDCQARAAFDVAALGSVLGATDGGDPVSVDRAVTVAMAEFDPALLPAAARVETLTLTEPVAEAPVAAPPSGASRRATRRAGRAAGTSAPPAVATGGGVATRGLTWRHLLAVFVIAAAVPFVPAIIRSMRIPPAPQSALVATTTAGAAVPEAAAKVAGGVVTSILVSDTAPTAASPTAATMPDDAPVVADAVTAALAPTLPPPTPAGPPPTATSLVGNPVAPASVPSAAVARPMATDPAGALGTGLVDLGDLGTYPSATALRTAYGTRAPALRRSLLTAPPAVTFPAAATLPCISKAGAPLRGGAHAVVAGRAVVILEPDIVRPDGGVTVERLVVLDAATCVAVA